MSANFAVDLVRFHLERHNYDSAVRVAMEANEEAPLREVLSRVRRTKLHAHTARVSTALFRIGAMSETALKKCLTPLAESLLTEYTNAFTNMLLWVDKSTAKYAAFMWLSDVSESKNWDFATQDRNHRLSSSSKIAGVERVRNAMNSLAGIVLESASFVDRSLAIRVLEMIIIHPWARLPFKGADIGPVGDVASAVVRLHALNALDDARVRRLSLLLVRGITRCDLIGAFIRALPKPRMQTVALRALLSEGYAAECRSVLGRFKETDASTLLTESERSRLVSANVRTEKIHDVLWSCASCASWMPMSADDKRIVVRRAMIAAHHGIVDANRRSNVHGPATMYRKCLDAGITFPPRFMKCVATASLPTDCSGPGHLAPSIAAWNDIVWLHSEIGEPIPDAVTAYYRLRVLTALLDDYGSRGTQRVPSDDAARTALVQHVRELMLGVRAKDRPDAAAFVRLFLSNATTSGRTSDLAFALEIADITRESWGVELVSRSDLEAWERRTRKHADLLTEEYGRLRHIACADMLAAYIVANARRTASHPSTA